MVSSCWAPGCTNRWKTDHIKVYRFPFSNRERLSQWLRAINRTCGKGQTTVRSDGYLQPSPHSRLCSVHFVSGAPSHDPVSIDYVPTLFPRSTRPRLDEKIKQERLNQRREKRRTRLLQKPPLQKSETKLATGTTSSQKTYEYTPPQSTSSHVNSQKRLQSGRQLKVQKVSLGNTLHKCCICQNMVGILYTFPRVVTTEGCEVQRMTAERLTKWMVAAGLDEYTTNSSETVCTRHFVTGRPAVRGDETDVDWAPTLFLNEKKHGAKKTSLSENTPQRCCICGSSSGKLFTFPRVVTSEGPTAQKKTTERLTKWMLAAKMQEYSSNSADAICSRHFVTGRPAVRHDCGNVDWVPHLFLHEQFVEETQMTSATDSRKQAAPTILSILLKKDSFNTPTSPSDHEVDVENESDHSNGAHDVVDDDRVNSTHTSQEFPCDEPPIKIKKEICSDDEEEFDAPLHFAETYVIHQNEYEQYLVPDDYSSDSSEENVGVVADVIKKEPENDEENVGVVTDVIKKEPEDDEESIEDLVTTFCLPVTEAEKGSDQEVRPDHQNQSDSKVHDEMGVATDLDTSPPKTNQDVATIFACPFCSREFHSQTELDLHMVGHTGDKPYICEKCHKTFAQKCNLQLHKRIVHLEGQQHKCTMCDMTFNAQTLLAEHLKTHTGEKPYRCNNCGSSYKCRDYWRRHIKGKACDKGGKRFKCDKCYKSFDRSDGLARHRSIHNK